MDVSWTYIDFENDNYLKERTENILRTGIGVREEGYNFSKAYKFGHWDGYNPMHENVQEGMRFPTGLISKVDDLLGDLQNTYRFQYEIIDDRPDPLLTEDDIPEEIELADGKILRDYQMNAIREQVKYQHGVMHLSTGSGKTNSAAGIIQMALDKVHHDETIAFFTHSKELFNQSKTVLEDTLNIPIGEVSSGKMKPKKVTMVMVPTAASALKVDVEKGVSLTAKQRVIKKMAKEIAPKYLKGVNQKQLLKAFIQNFNIKTKADEQLLQEIEEMIYTSESDAKLKFKLNGYVAEYNNILKKKNEAKFKKKKEMEDFLNTVILGVMDEAHRIKGDGYYNVAMACENALIKVGLTGSIDEKDPMLMARMKGAFHKVVAVTRNHEMIERGILAEPAIKMVPIEMVLQGNEKRDILHEKDYMTSYDVGVVNNDYRNALAAKITQQWYERDEVVVIVVSRIEHGENMSSLLDQLNVPYAFIHGSHTEEEREQALQRVRDGELKVLISSTILDEGVDINKLSVLINISAGKSIRQILQRVGRILRRKEGENKAVVVDFLDRTNKHLKKHSEERMRVYKDEKFDIEYMES